MKTLLTKEEKWSLIVQVILGITFMGVGLTFLYRDQLLWNVSYIAVLSGLGIAVLVLAYRAIRHKNWLDGLFSLGALIFGIIIASNQRSLGEFLALSFGIWAVFNGLVHGLELYIAIIKKQRGKFFVTVQALIDIIMGLMLIVSGINNFYLINLQVGVYGLLFGLMQVLSVYRIIVREGYSIKMPAPVILTAFIPSFLVKRVDKDTLNNPEIVKAVVEKTQGDYISIYIYAKDHGYNRMGHIDIGYNGAIYSYGCHDPYDRVKSQAYGAGLLIVGSESEYVQYCVDDDTTVFRFLCKLTPEQREIVENRIAQLMDDAYYYDYPMYKEDAAENFLGMLKNGNVTVDYYRFNAGPFKTYNLFTTNCVMVVDYIIQKTGMQLFHMSGIITPGTYYDYLDRNLNKPGSIVVKKEIFRRNDVRFKHKKAN